MIPEHFVINDKSYHKDSVYRVTFKNESHLECFAYLTKQEAIDGKNFLLIQGAKACKIHLPKINS